VYLVPRPVGAGTMTIQVTSRNAAFRMGKIGQSRAGAGPGSAETSL